MPSHDVSLHMETRKLAYASLVLTAIVAVGVCRWSAGELIGSRPHSTAPYSPSTSAHPLRLTPRVRLDDLRLRPATVMNGDRDAFGFRQHVAVVAERSAPRNAVGAALAPLRTPVLQAPAPPIRFIGSLTLRGATWAILSDCAGYVAAARRREWFLGEWEVLRIDEESVVVERTGAAPARIPMAGCAPRNYG